MSTGYVECRHYLAITNGLSNHPPYEFEIVQMVGVYDTQRIGLEGCTVCLIRRRG